MRSKPYNKKSKDNIEMKEKPPYRCVKVPLKLVIKNEEVIIPKITGAVTRAHKIIVHTLQFMKLYILSFFEDEGTIPKIDKTFVNCCMKVICGERQGRGRKPKKKVQELKDKLTTFFNKNYKSLMVKDDNLDYIHLNTVLDYLTIDILTMYENNIKLHYVEYLEKYVNVVWKKSMLVDKIRKLKKTKNTRKEGINKLCNQLRKIKNDMLSGDRKSNNWYHIWINKQIGFSVPNKTFKKESLYYDLQCEPFDYLPCMINMMKVIEEDKVGLLNPFPLRTDIIPKHIRIDTTTIVNLLFTKKHGKKRNYLTKGNLKRYEDKIWNFFFRTEKKCFEQSDYTFNQMIETDGVSCSILMIRNDLKGKKRIPQNKGKNKEVYIDEVKDTSELVDKNIVAIDPGQNTLLYCVDGDSKEANKFTYSQNQRRKETKSKKYTMIVNELKKYIIKEKTIVDYETELSKYNRKTLDIQKFTEYIQKKNEINHILSKFYKKYIFRKLKLNGYTNRKRSEQRLIKNFRKMFGNTNETIIVLGDFEQRKHRKFKEPTKGIGFRSLFRKQGYKVYLADEFRTSCKCSNCEGGECKKFLIGTNPKPGKDNQILLHTLLRCKNGCGIWNRDCNGAKNIYKVSHNAVMGEDRPEHLLRTH